MYAEYKISRGTTQQLVGQLVQFWEGYKYCYHPNLSLLGGLLSPYKVCEINSVLPITFSLHVPIRQICYVS